MSINLQFGTTLHSKDTKEEVDIRVVKGISI